jgi:hypothetical protein
MFYTIETAKAAYPRMTGSDKQIVWAASIRDKLALELSRDAAALAHEIARNQAVYADQSEMEALAQKQGITVDELAKAIDLFIEKATARIDVLNARIAQEEAHWWIENRDVLNIERYAKR